MSGFMPSPVFIAERMHVDLLVRIEQQSGRQTPFDPGAIVLLQRQDQPLGRQTEGQPLNTGGGGNCLFSHNTSLSGICIRHCTEVWAAAPTAALLMPKCFLMNSTIAPKCSVADA